MGLREWLMVVGGVIVLVIIADGIRRMRNASKDQHEFDEETRVRHAELQRELPKGGARVVKTLSPDVFDDDPVPVLRQVVIVPTDSEASSEAHDDVDQPSLSASDHYTVADANSDDLQTDPLTSAYDESFEADIDLVESAVSHHDLPDDPVMLEPQSHQEKPWRYQSQQELNQQSQDHASADIVEDAPEEEVLETSSIEPPSPVHEAVVEPITEVEATDVLEVDETSARSDLPEESDLDDLEPLDASQALADAEADAIEQAALEAQHQQDIKMARLQQEYEQELLRQQQEYEQQLAAQAEQVLAPESEPEPEVPNDPVAEAALRILGACAEKRPLVRKRLDDPYQDDAQSSTSQPKPPVAAERSPSEPSYGAETNVTPLKPRSQASAKPAPKPEPKAEVLREKPVKRQPLLSEEDERNQLAEASELLVLNVKCKDAAGFSGPRLLQVALACGMQYGEMQVFHRFIKTESGSRIQFSMLSSVNPGTFDMDSIDELSLPSVTFIMGLPAQGNSQECFTYMLETAKVIVKNLNGELRDEQRSVMTPQTVEHYRQRIQDFERKQLARAR